LGFFIRLRSLQLHSEMNFCRRTYLFLYNAVQFAGWFSVLTDRITNLDNPTLSANGQFFLYIFQTLAVLEILHCLIGVVRASPVTTIIQVVSRLQLILVHSYVPDAKVSTGLLPMVTAWGLVEVVRYMYLALNLFQMSPKWLLWARYSFFYVLYPLGVYGEMRVLYDSLPYMMRSGVLSVSLPNDWNFSFSFAWYAWVLIYVIYLPGLYVQYTHMMKQRVKALGGPVELKKNV
jgi:very-long-chain (3R)-3-hydroxyacyl-CoA dehydratase